MSMIVWEDKYSVDIQEIDEQHKRLVEIINELYDAIAAKKNRDQLSVVLNELVEYTKVHFAVEETLMRIFHYEEYREHKGIHDRIVNQVLDFQRQFNAGNDKVGMELLLFLKDWLFEHIEKVDKKYSKHFLKHGVKKKWKFW